MSRGFRDFTGIAAPLPLANVDTDKIIPARFLKTIRREGLGAGLFHTLRYDEGGAERPDFVLNRAPWRGASILVALDNFGCGSSREHAPWALLDFGIRCIIAPGFADIFHNNCFRNGILPVTLDAERCTGLLRAAAEPASATFAVSLTAQTISRAGAAPLPFAIDADRKRQLLLGLDEIDATLARLPQIEAFETARGGRGIPGIPVGIGLEPAAP